MATPKREELLERFAAAKQYAADMEALRNGAFALGRPWTQEQQDALEAARTERGLCARELTEDSIARRESAAGRARRAPTEGDLA
jgi:hypothetical protein